jgi:chitodextrinase
VGGVVVSYNGHQYTAKWWTQGEQPDTHSGQWDVWTDNGACSGGGGPPTPSPTVVPTTGGPAPTPTGTQSGTWQPNHAYAVGDIVTYDGHTYKCIQAHTSLVGWEPPNVPALWQLLS